MPLCGGTKTVQRKLVLLYVSPGLDSIPLRLRTRAQAGPAKTHVC